MTTDQQQPVGDAWRDHGHMCPRCTFYYMDERPEEVDGAPWTYRQQCSHCGMGAHYSCWEPLLLKKPEDLYERLDRSGWAEFTDWVVDYTDDLVDVRIDEDGLITCGAGTWASTFEFPGNIQELMADLQTAEDVARADWTGMTGEAARRLVPLSAVHNTDYDDPAMDCMPEDWWRDGDGDWHPPTDERQDPTE